MKKKPKNNGEELLDIMDNELAMTISAYEALLNQCHKLALSMGYNDNYIISKVMPKTSNERTNTDRIAKWFDGIRDEAWAYMLRLEAAHEQNCEKEKLLASLNLTLKQKKLLGLC